MKFVTAILFFCVVLVSHHATAGNAEVRDVALINNCKPKKIEVYTQSIGADGDTIYRVQCDIPKAVGTDPKAVTSDAILVSCQLNLCSLLRQVTMEKKK